MSFIFQSLRYDLKLHKHIFQKNRVLLYILDIYLEILYLLHVLHMSNLLNILKSYFLYLNKYLLKHNILHWQSCELLGFVIFHHHILEKGLFL